MKDIFDKIDAMKKKEISLSAYELKELISKAPAKALEKLAEDDDADVRSCVASNNRAPATVLEKLAGDAAKKVRCSVAYNDNTPPSVLEKLAGSAAADVRRSVASNNNTPAAVLEKLARDKEMYVRCDVASNNNTPAAVLEKLAGDATENVRRSVAYNDNTPAAVLEKLAKDEDWKIRDGVAEHPNTPAVALEKLARDRKPDIKIHVAEHPNTPAAALGMLAREDDWNIRYRVAEHPNTPAAVLKKLAGDKEMYVRSCVANNDHTPAAVLEKMANDDAVVRNFAKLPNPKKFNDLVNIWSKLKAECGELMCGGLIYGHNIKLMDGELARAQWGRVIRTKKIPTAKLNRCGEIFCGPLFVSEKHSWPESNGKHMLPLFQINLNYWGRIMKMDFGAGVLQVWACQVDISKQIVRVLPHEDVKKKYLIREIPEPILAIDEDYPNSIPITWRESDEGESWAITGYGEKHFAVQLWKDDIDDCLPNLEVEVKQGRKLVRVPVEMTEQKRKRIQILVEKFKVLANEACKDFETWSDSIGGSFSPIQYNASERPPVLLNVETDYEPYFWGDSGNAQIFYEKQPDGSFKYSFEWRCS